MPVPCLLALAGACCVALFGCARDPGTAPRSRPVAPRAHAEVRALLDAQVAAWNRHDLEGFLGGYRRDDHVVFVTPEGSSRGFAELERRYQESYNAPEKFGELAFTDVRCTTVDEDSVLVEGSWRLSRHEDSPHGRFVLVVCRLEGGWRIVSDFTTVDSSGD